MFLGAQYLLFLYHNPYLSPHFRIVTSDLYNDMFDKVKVIAEAKGVIHRKSFLYTG